MVSVLPEAFENVVRYGLVGLVLGRFICRRMSPFSRAGSSGDAWQMDSSCNSESGILGPSLFISENTPHPSTVNPPSIISTCGAWLSSRPRSFFSARSRISTPPEQSQTGTMDDLPSSGTVNLMTLRLISSSDGVFDDGVVGRLNGPAPTRNAPELFVGGDGVDAAWRCESRNASAMGDSAEGLPDECCDEYGWLLGPVDGRVCGFGGATGEAMPDRDALRACSCGERVILRFGSWLFCRGEGERTGRGGRLCPGGGSGSGWLVLKAGASESVGVLRPESWLGGSSERGVGRALDGGGGGCPRGGGGIGGRPGRLLGVWTFVDPVFGWGRGRPAGPVLVESWPSRTRRGRLSEPVFGVRCNGAGRPLSSLRGPCRDTGDEYEPSLLTLPVRLCSCTRGRLWLVEAEEHLCLSALTPATILILSPTVKTPISFKVGWSSSSSTSPRMSLARNMVA